MSYNCHTFKVKKIQNFRIPVQSFFKHSRVDLHPKRINHDDGTVTFSFGEPSLSGKIENDIFICESIDVSGEGSGWIMAEILEPAFKASMGKLVASCVWEGGDSINRLIVFNGNVSWEDIKI